MGIYTADLQHIYMVYLNRPADPDGLAYWEKAAASGASINEIAANFAASGEYHQAHAGQTNKQLVESFYQNLFSRAGDPDGVAYWVNAMDHGASAADIGGIILHAAQSADAAVIASKTAAANDFTAALAQQDGANAAAMLAKAAHWLAGVTDATSQAAASAGLSAFAASAQQPVVVDVDAIRPAYQPTGTIQVTVTFSSAVTVDTSKGTPTITLETGANDAVATYVGGSGSNQLVFTFKVKSGDNTTALDYVSSTALALNGGVIKSPGNYNALLTLPAPGAPHSLSANHVIKIDSTPPQVVTPSGDTHLSPSANIELTFNEVVKPDLYTTFIIKEVGGTQTISLTPRDDYNHAYTSSADGKTIILDPQVGLKANTTYTVTINGDVFDTSGNYWGAPVVNPNLYGSHPTPVGTALTFTTGDAATPTLTADGDTLRVTGNNGGNALVIDLNSHTASEGILPAGAFSAIDATRFSSGVKLQGLDGGHNTLTGSTHSDTLIGGNAAGGVAAVNVLRGGEGSDLLVAGTGSDNTFNYAESEFYTGTSTLIIKGLESIGNWGAAHSNTISFDGMTLAAGSGDGVGIHNGNFPTTMHINANGLAVFDSFPAVYDQIMPNSAQFYLSWYVAEVLEKAPAGTSAAFNYKDDAFLVVMTGKELYGAPLFELIKLTGVHSDGLVFDGAGHITTGSFIGNT